MRAERLRCEYLKNPVGVDFDNPRVFWNCADGTKQIAYQIIATDDNNNLLWDSGKVESSQMAGVTLPIKTESRQIVFWKVKLWDENDTEGEWSETATFEIGLKSPSDFKAKWISGNYKVDKKKRYPVDCFRKKFIIEKEVKNARLYASACGLYVTQINGINAGDFVLAPGYTDYRKRIQYQTYDVTDQLKNGENIITAELADGWYRGSIGAWGLKNQFGTQTKIFLQLEITFADGTKGTVCTDKTWRWSNDGPIRFADNKDGEIVDVRNNPLYNNNAIEVDYDVTPTASNNVPVLEHERFSAKKIVTPSGKTVLDFSQNIAGYIEFKFKAKSGQKIRLRFGEMLDADGEFTQKNIQCVNKKKTTPLQKIEYTCKEGINTYKTKFAVFGFQYVLVESDFEIDEKDFTAIAVYSDIEQTGFFSSSNELLNKLVDATIWSAKGNSLDIPTDCPTRERHGWTGDAQIFFETASYLFDYASFSKKYLTDMYDWQRKNGMLPQIVPYGGVDFYMWTMNGSVGWADAGVLIPYRFYKIFGDKKILEEYYDRMKKYAEFMIDRCGKKSVLMAVYTKPSHVKGNDKKFIVNYGQSYGEWAEPADVKPMKWTDTVSPHPEVSTAYTSYVMSVMSKIAEILGKTEDSHYFNCYAENCKKAYQALVKTKEYDLDTDRQAQLVRPLYFDLLDEKQTEYAKERLVRAMENYGWRLGTGFLSTPLILDVLESIDTQYAYKLLENEEMPGWLFMPKNGATTIWESWEGTKAQGGIASLNHYSKGAVCEWLFKSMCGINIDGENHFKIKPVHGGKFTYANAKYNSIYGTVESGWKRENGNVIFEMTIPSNTTAEVILPDGTMETVSTGTYKYEIKEG